MIVQAFLRWAETAGAGERAKAASALGRAFIRSGMDDARREEVRLAMTWVLDDPSPRVRLALAGAIADSARAPRPLIVAFAEDQPEIAATVLPRSPVLTDDDLVDLAARGTDLTRALIASRNGLGRCVSAAIAEIGGSCSIAILLENISADIPRFSLRRVAERYGTSCEIRNLLLERQDLPPDARHMLVACTRDALISSSLVQGLLAPSRIGHVAADAMATATVTIAGETLTENVGCLVAHLRSGGYLTPAFLMQTLCNGELDFFAAAISDLSGSGEKRTRSVLANGQMHAVRALFISAGLAPDICAVFVEATMLWRRSSQSGDGFITSGISADLIDLYRDRTERLSPVSELIDMIERFHLRQQRQSAREFASHSIAIAA